MKSRMTAEQEKLAEVPTVAPVSRLTGELRDLANLCQNGHVSSFVGDDVLEQAKRLAYWLGVQIEAADHQRVASGDDPVVWEPPEFGG